MTIYKPNNPDRKQGKKLFNGPEVVVDDKLPLTDKAKGDDGGALLFVRRHPITNTEVLRRRRTIRCVLVLTALILVVAVAFASALFVYKRISNAPFMGTCYVPYDDDFARDLPNAEGQRGATPRHGSFEEGVEIDQANGVYEKLEVPPVLDFRRSTVLHDFEKNLTAIVDKDHGRCFILPLNRDAVKPPKNFLDLLEKFKSGYYMPNAEIMRESYMVVNPPIDDLEPMGYYIWNDCQFFTTYHLVKNDVDQPIAMSRKKRSASCSMAGDGFCLGATFTDRMTCISFAGCIQ
jgi:integral membrane protein 2B